MKRSRLFTLFAAGLFLWPTLSASAASEQADGEQLQKLVKDLKTAMQRAEDNKTADAKFLRELRDIIRLYETSELVELLFEDFQDGDYTASPAWVVDSGNFRVAQGVGLRSQFTPVISASHSTVQTQEQDLSTALLGAVVSELHKTHGEVQAVTPQWAEIYLPLEISNTFTLRLQLQTGAQEKGEGQLEFGPYQGNQRDTGYRLVSISGQQPTLELQRLTGGRSAVVGTSRSVAQLGDTWPHSFEWRRNDNGSMEISLDGQVIIQAIDRTTKYTFDGFTLVNRGGEYTLRQIEVLGSH